RVLMAEDNEINQEIARYVLEDMGLVVDVVSDGTGTVERIETCEPGAYDAVLMDVRMPIMDGYEATRRIRALADPARSGIPIIAVTANTFDEDMQEAQDAGMTAFLSKPLDVERVGRVLCETMRQQQ
ncbi:MAG: response regulator, partial [Atopobiaceae bacterium]|nr:response regulator [Atopobiaceae bacterium]